jgi:ATP-dependent helicase/DNAse subunit B
LNSRNQLSSLSPIAGLKGTHAAIAQLLDEFQRAGLSPSDVVSTLRSTAAADSRYLEMAAVYEGYWQRLDELGCCDQKQLAFRAREILSQGEDIRFDFVAVDGFDRFSRLQAQVIKGLCTHARKARILFDYVPEDPIPEDYQWKTESFAELIDELGQSFTANSPEFRALEAVAPAMFSTLDRFMEMQEIARRCKQLMVQENISPDRILVVARDLKPYKAAADAAFVDAGICSYFIDEAVKLHELPVVHYIHNLLTMHHEKFPRELVIDTLRSPYCKLDYLKLSKLDVAKLDSKSWREYVYRGVQDWNKSLHSAAEELQAGIRLLFETVHPIVGENSWTHYVSWVENLLDNLLSIPETGKCRDDYDSRKAIIELRKCFAVLVQLDSFSGTEKITYEHFLHSLWELVESANYRRNPPIDPAVTICGAELAPNETFDHIFIAGMVESEFPKRTGSSGFVSAEEMAKWSSFGVNISNPRLHPGFETALFKSLCERGRKSVQLSCPRYEMSGEEVIPSFLMTGGEDDRITFIDPYCSSLEKPTSYREAAAALWWQEMEDPLGAGSAHPILEPYLREIENKVLTHRERSVSPEYGVCNGNLTDSVIANLIQINSRDHFSVSALNSYGQCPFRYWAAQILHIENREPRPLQIPATALGTAYHSALEKFYGDLKTAGLKIGDCDEEIIEDHVEAAIQHAITELESCKEFFRDEFWVYNQREIAFRLRRFIAEELMRSRKDKEYFEPEYFEAEFSKKDEAMAPPLVLNTTSGPLVIHGKIDRVDIGANDRARVIDYKSGSASISMKDVLEGRNLQLPVYALAVQRSLKPGTKVVAGRFLSISSGKAIGNIDFEKRSDILQHAETLIHSYVTGIAAGDFRLKPSNRKVCDNCDHLKICRISERLFQKDAEDRNEQPD